MSNKWNEYQRTLRSKGFKLSSSEMSQLYKKHNKNVEKTIQELTAPIKKIIVKFKPKKISIIKKNSLQNLIKTVTEETYQISESEIKDIWELTGDFDTAYEIIEKNYLTKSQQEEVEQLKKKFSNILPDETITYDIQSGNLSMIQALQAIIDDLPLNQKYALGIEGNGKYYALNDRNRARLYEILEDLLIDENKEYNESDGILIQNMVKTGTKFSIYRFDPSVVQHHHTESAFFPYYHTTEADLTRYQIYKEGEILPENACRVNCFIYTLQQSGLFSDSEIDRIKMYCKVRAIPIRKITEICQEFNFGVRLKRRMSGKTCNTDINVRGQNKIVEMACVENHYFINDPPIDGIEPFRYVENLIKYKKLAEIPVKDKIYLTSQYYKNENLELKNIKPIDPVFNSEGKLVSEGDYRPIRISDKKEIDMHVWCADFESYQDLECATDKSKCILKPLLLVTQRCLFINEKSDITECLDNTKIYQRVNSDHIKEWMELMTSYVTCTYEKNKYVPQQNVLVYFHNLKYDISQLISILPNNCQIISYLPKGNSVLSLKIKYQGEYLGKETNYNIEFRCSYRLMTQSIADCAKTYLNAKISKDSCPYELYNSKTYDLEYINKELLSGYKNCNINDYAEFIREDKFYLHEYNIKYCLKDVEIQSRSLIQFARMILESLAINPFNYLTISGISDAYFVQEGCYDGVYELSGIPQMFCAKAVVGGRCMTNQNKKYHITEKIEDSDVNSLYPAAMSRVEGFPVGKPHYFENYDYQILSKISYYIVEINITEVRKKRDFPLISAKGDNGVRYFTNDFRGKIVVDKYALEDFIEYQDIRFEIIRGYMWEGFNPKICTVIQKVFNMRLEMKKQGSNKQQIYKLIMNNGYGKNLLKPTELDSRIYNQKEADVFIQNSFENIKSYIPLTNNKVLVESYVKTLKHWNRVHCGVAILSMSKRYMNEAICLSEDLGIKIFYQDTDSMQHCAGDRELIAKEYKKKYGRDMFGKGLGQFSSDFEGDNVGLEAYYLGKKQYGLRLSSGGYHLRQKGISTALMKFEDYKEMYEGKTLVKNLLECQAGIRTTHLSASLVRDFKREIKCLLI